MTCFENPVINSHSLSGLGRGQSAHAGNTPYCRLGLHRKHLHLCPNLLHLYCVSSVLLLSSINLSLLSLPLSVCIPFLSVRAIPPLPPVRRALPASALLLSIVQHPPDRVIHLHWADTCAVLTVRALTSERKESSDPVTAKTHYRRENTSDHQLLQAHPTAPTVGVLTHVMLPGSMILPHQRAAPNTGSRRYKATLCFQDILFQHF